MSTKGSELSVITKAKALSEYDLTITDKSPKRYRFTLVARLQNYSLDVIEALISANEIYVSAPDTDEARERLKFGGTTMLLDCDSTLISMPHDSTDPYSNSWADSEINAWLALMSIR